MEGSIPSLYAATFSRHIITPLSNTTQLHPLTPLSLPSTHQYADKGPKNARDVPTKAKPNWVIIPENVSEWWKPYSVREKEKKEAAKAGGKGRSVGLRQASEVEARGEDL